MRISPHLMFDGQCRAAFTRYQQLLGGELRMLTFGESPMAAGVDLKWHDRIVHVTLQLGDLELAGADVLPQDYATPQGFSVLLTFEDPARGEHVFNELARGGEIRFPCQPTFLGLPVSVSWWTSSAYRGRSVANNPLPPNTTMIQRRRSPPAPELTLARGRAGRRFFSSNTESKDVLIGGYKTRRNAL